MSRVPPLPTCSCRVLYLGSAIPIETTVGIESIQRPCRERYVNQDHTTSGIDTNLTVFGSGVMMSYLEDKSTQTWFPISTLHVCAAVKAVAQVDGSVRFASLDTPPAMTSNSPPLFTCIMRRSKGIKVLECHVFLCKSDDDAMSLVQSCMHAYQHEEGWLDGSIPPEPPGMTHLVSSDSGNEKRSINSAYLNTDRDDLLRNTIGRGFDSKQSNLEQKFNDLGVNDDYLQFFPSASGPVSGPTPTPEARLSTTLTSQYPYQYPAVTPQSQSGSCVFQINHSAAPIGLSSTPNYQPVMYPQASLQIGPYSDQYFRPQMAPQSVPWVGLPMGNGYFSDQNMNNGQQFVMCTNVPFFTVNQEPSRQGKMNTQHRKKYLTKMRRKKGDDSSSDDEEIFYVKRSDLDRNFHEIQDIGKHGREKIVEEDLQTRHTRQFYPVRTLQRSSSMQHQPSPTFQSPQPTNNRQHIHSQPSDFIVYAPQTGKRINNNGTDQSQLDQNVNVREEEHPVTEREIRNHLNQKPLNFSRREQDECVYYNQGAEQGIRRQALENQDKHDSGGFQRHDIGLDLGRYDQQPLGGGDNGTYLESRSIVRAGLTDKLGGGVYERRLPTLSSTSQQVGAPLEALQTSMDQYAQLTEGLGYLP